jgi:predicted DNA binding CopG/RHH family protein
MKPRKVPVMTTDAGAEAFLDQDLSGLDYSQFKPLTWEAEPKTARVNMRWEIHPPRPRPPPDGAA